MAGDVPKSLLKTLSFVATKASWHVPKSRLNIQYCRHKRGLNYPDFSFELFFFAVTNTIKNPPEVWLQPPIFVTSKTRGDVLTSLPTQLEIVPKVSDIQWCNTYKCWNTVLSCSHWLARLGTCKFTTVSSASWCEREIPWYGESRCE